MNHQEGLQEYMECNRQLTGAMDRINDNFTSMFEGLEVSMIDLSSNLDKVIAQASAEAYREQVELETAQTAAPSAYRVGEIVDDGEQLENSMFKDVPPEIKAAAERAGIGIEDLCELALKFVDKRNEAKQKRREDKFKRLELKKETALKLAALEVDYKLRREVDVKVSDVRWGAFKEFVSATNNVVSTGLRWGSLSAGAVGITYFITSMAT